MLSPLQSLHGMGNQLYGNRKEKNRNNKLILVQFTSREEEKTHFFGKTRFLFSYFRGMFCVPVSFPKSPSSWVLVLVELCILLP